MSISNINYYFILMIKTFILFNIYKIIESLVLRVKIII